MSAAWCRPTSGWPFSLATPNELIKDRRTTAYNVGRTLSLRDFDAGRDDLGPLARELAADRIWARRCSPASCAGPAGSPTSP